MSPTEIALLGLVCWSIALTAMIGLFRLGLVATSGRASNTFKASGEDTPGFGQRLARAHANCYENLPLSAAILLYAIAASATGVTDGLAYVLLGLRIGQSLFHLLSTSRLFVALRFALYLPQLIIISWWVAQFFQA